ncbi:MAG: signal peptidase II [Nanoarchaeota archaeon]|nr:signal peptidase II [Nanoarchaeota archaeon]
MARKKSKSSSRKKKINIKSNESAKDMGSDRKIDYLFYVIPLSIIAVVIFLDQLTKYLFYQKNFIIIKGILEIKSSTNAGIVFGWFSNNLIVVAALPLLIIAFFTSQYFSEAKKHKLVIVAFPLIVAGLLGNLIDRFTRGFVVDFILIPIKPEQNISNFNLADTSLIAGVLLVIIYLLWYSGE